ncbi:potassium voltage-gated channel subfamily KQT member 1-like [Schistocerca americana]|uniref:potassium voltage-gated channel subfamily KQT member 1-like n=1 Tax=Schistocerca americana TaxID=7009 RepID=UPI001F4F1579|nr:potassium voltage-gated channel subfamily KQT member 1-like [Schistocerca americana]XP_049959392.1 potassium voltage-gated channel subfamily KQT member 1-like [Schistocerca serialis cubense]
MLCVVMASMNRTEQELLYRRSREVVVPCQKHEDVVLSVLKSPLITSNHRPHARLRPPTSGEETDAEQLRRFRSPRFGEAHHKRVPTPIKRRRRSAGRDGGAGEGGGRGGPPGVPDPYYPIYLPIDQAFKAKYVFHHKKGKTFQERVYVFLEHPGGWLCFVYHFTV